MEEQICSDVLRIIFKYLKPNDLRAASLVCRYWKNIANQEFYARGPGSYQLTVDSWIYSGNIVTEFVYACLSKMLKFHMFFIYNEMVHDCIRTCYCNYLESDYYSLTIRIFMPLELRSYIVNMSIPDFYKIEINTFTFIRARSIVMSVYCPELNIFLDIDYELLPSVKFKFESYFDNTNPMKSCMIIFCDLDNIPLLKCLLASLDSWFPESFIPIWGGITREIFICRQTNCRRHCMDPAGCVFFFISHMDLEIWRTTWPWDNDPVEIMEARFQEWKLTVRLKTYSLGFIYISGMRCDNYFFIECDLFEKVFPQVPYVYLFGPGAFTGNNLTDLSTKYSSFDYLWNDGPQALGSVETSIMILTYD